MSTGRGLRKGEKTGAFYIGAYKTGCVGYHSGRGCTAAGVSWDKKEDIICNSSYY